ncbi:hypothetical protein Syun_025070 [Stephania yunnanensis]|uniref:non-specific serine/threonine protein kinase n=1 Tax=Stephania yunnanensis TaxID=152371 RepID=A0AAP0HVW4_9MAGN
MGFLINSLLLLTLCLSSLTLSALSFEPRNPEVEALISVRRALDDPRGALNNWDEDSVDPCSWAMVTCSPENHVIGLEAPSQNLSGTLSGSIANLTNLRQIMLQNNNLSGEIPPELGRLPKLQALDLSSNRFINMVPETLGLLNALQYLRLNNNSFSGAFPASLAKIPRLLFLVAGNPLICKRKAQKLAIVLGLSLGVSSLVVLAFALFVWCRKTHKNHIILNINDKQEEGLINLGNLRQISLRELHSATDHFSPKNILGQGGFGNVYKGKLSDGTIVAVKRLKDLSGVTGEVQFKTEVEMISLAVHRHLLRLIGFCATSHERLLVYPYMSNGSVASRLRGRPIATHDKDLSLFDMVVRGVIRVSYSRAAPPFKTVILSPKPVLDWNTRKRIALGAARGLMYLHEQCDPKIIHRDVKAANVLLDDYCEAVVGDFGLAKLLDHADSHVTTAVRGTVGHIAPEYLSTGQSSEKTDVFGFGILLLELITGMRALEFGKAVNQKGAVALDWVKKHQQDKKLEMLVDKDLGKNYDWIEVGEIVQVALLCTQYLPAHRPKMSEVVRMLEGDGLADKWEASQQYNHSTTPTTDAKIYTNNNTNSNTTAPTTTSMRTTKHVHHDSMLAMMMDDDDEHSLDVHAMELSGPR